MNSVSGVSVVGVAYGVHSGRVVGYGMRDSAPTADHFYVELKKQSGESVVFEGGSLRAEAEALDIDVGQTVTIEAARGSAPRIVHKTRFKGNVNMSTQEQAHSDGQAMSDGEAADVIAPAPVNSISRAKQRRQELEDGAVAQPDGVATAEMVNSIQQAQRGEKSGASVADRDETQAAATANPAPATLLNGRFVRDAKGEYRRVGEERVALADEGERIRFVSKEMDAFQAAVELAKAKGWDAIEVAGTDVFKAEAWFHAKSAGLEVVGYEPNREDLDRLFQAGTERFAVSLIDPKGKPASHATYEKAEEAMAAYLALTKADFGVDLGVGSYAALTDREGKLDAARVAEGKGSYQVKFAKDDGRKLFESLEAADKAAAEVNAPAPSELSASRKDAQRLALDAGFSVRSATAADGRYAGPLIQETAHHVVQDLGRKESVVHDKFRLAGLPTGAEKSPAQSVRIQYQGGRGKVEVAAEKSQALAR